MCLPRIPPTEIDFPVAPEKTDRATFSSLSDSLLSRFLLEITKIPLPLTVTVQEFKARFTSKRRLVDHSVANVNISVYDFEVIFRNRSRKRPAQYASIGSAEVAAMARTI